MSPLWVPRQAHRVEGGTSFLIDGWKFRLGELRISGGKGQGKVRGCVCELEPISADDDDEERYGAELARMAKVFFDTVVQGSGVDIHEMKLVGPIADGRDGLVRQYLDLLTFARA
jgi:TATA-binding related factor (TRF) of subunit 20 of Mediator complex